MRRFLCCLLCLSLVLLPVRAEGFVRYCALTFDDGPSGRYTRTLLDGLAERGVKATFLLCGYRIRQYPRETQRILDEGHEIGCHGYSHRNMTKLSRREIAAEITDTLALMPEGSRVTFLRPPGGCCSTGICQVAEAMGMPILSWSVDPRDWATADAAAVENAILSQVSDGDVILLHDMSDSSVQAALDIIDTLQAQGYRFATVSELAAIRNIRLRPGQSYTAFRRRESGL